MERVSIRDGSCPILIVAPHGPNDPNTDLLAELIAEELDAYAVINRGWERAKAVDYFNDKANCNNVQHCQEDVVRDEFLKPILKYCTRMQKEYGVGCMFLIHGVSNGIRVKTGNPDLELILGYGAGEPPRWSCDEWVRNAFIHYLQDSGINVFGGKAGGDYAGWGRNNLNQLYTVWHHGIIHSLQLELVRDLRCDKNMCQLTSNIVSEAIAKLIENIEEASEPDSEPFNPEVVFEEI